MALGTAAAIITALAAVGGTAASISAQRGAKKTAKGQREQAERVRADELKKAEVLATEAEALPAKAAKTASIAAGRKRRPRSTLATGPRGLLDEPAVKKPTLLGG